MSLVELKEAIASEDWSFIEDFVKTHEFSRTFNSPLKNVVVEGLWSIVQRTNLEERTFGDVSEARIRLSLSALRILSRENLDLTVLQKKDSIEFLARAGVRGFSIELSTDFISLCINLCLLEESCRDFLGMDDFFLSAITILQEDDVEACPLHFVVAYAIFLATLVRENALVFEEMCNGSIALAKALHIHAAMLLEGPFADQKKRMSLPKSKEKEPRGVQRLMTPEERTSRKPQVINTIVNILKTVFNLQNSRILLPAFFETFDVSLMIRLCSIDSDPIKQQTLCVMMDLPDEQIIHLAKSRPILLFFMELLFRTVLSHRDVSLDVLALALCQTLLRIMALDAAAKDFFQRHLQPLRSGRFSHDTMDADVVRFLIDMDLAPKKPLEELVKPYLTCYNFELKTSVAELLFALVNERVDELIELVGLGNVMGFLVAKGLMAAPGEATSLSSVMEEKLGFEDDLDEGGEEAGRDGKEDSELIPECEPRWSEEDHGVEGNEEDETNGKGKEEVDDD